MGDIVNDDEKTKEQLEHVLSKLRLQNAVLKKSITATISADLEVGETCHHAEKMLNFKKK